MTTRLSTVLPVLAVVALLALLLALAGCAVPAAPVAATAPTTDRTVVPLAAAPRAPETAPAPERPLTAVSHLEQSRPVSLAVPAIGLRTGRLLDLRADAGGVLEVPADAATVGWSTLAPTPGARGPAVIVAHDDGMFARLPELAPGDQVTVHRADGTEAVFSVYRIERFPRTAFPTGDVHGATTGPELRLVTAGGVYSRDEASLDNLVAFARLDGIR